MEQDKALMSVINEMVKKKKTQGAKIWYASDRGCQGLEAGRQQKVLYALKKPSSLCAGQRMGNWFCYCSGQEDDPAAGHKYCGNCTSTFIPGDVNGKPLKKSNVSGINDLLFLNDNDNATMDIMTNMISRIESKISWEWTKSNPLLKCQTVNERPVPFSIQKPSVLCENKLAGARVCMCARNRPEKELKEVCGKCDTLLKVQTIDGRMLEE